MPNFKSIPFEMGELLGASRMWPTYVYSPNYPMWKRVSRVGNMFRTSCVTFTTMSLLIGLTVIIYYLNNVNQKNLIISFHLTEKECGIFNGSGDSKVSLSRLVPIAKMSYMVS